MWKDRLSAPFAHSQSRPRSQSPAPRRPLHLTAAATVQKPGYSPRSSSLSLISNASAPALNLPEPLPGDAERRLPTAPGDNDDPLAVVTSILGLPSDGALTGEKAAVKAEDFEGQSLQQFIDTSNDWDDATEKPASDTAGTQEFEQKAAEFEDLHRSIASCDAILGSSERYLSGFQRDLAAISGEIEQLQARSALLNVRLERRQSAEKLLGPAIERISLSPSVVNTICYGSLDDQWVEALAELERHIEHIDRLAKSPEKPKAVEDIVPLLSDLTNKALERIRDYLVAQIKALRSPNVNALIIQLDSLMPMKRLYKFLAQHHHKLAEEICQAYVYTMRWYYLNRFSRYFQALEKLKLHVMDRQDVLGHNDPSRRGLASKDAIPPHEAFALGRREELLRHSNHAAMPAYLAEETSSHHYLEVPFLNFNLALTDNATAEYTFLTDFLAPHSFQYVARKFSDIFEPTFDLGRKLTKYLIDGNPDCLGVLLCVRLNQSFAFELQRRKVPCLDSYTNATNMLLWPRFQIIMDLHGDSLRRATAALSGRSTAALALMGTDASKQSTAPHFLTQRFGQFLHAILVLSGQAGDDEPVSNSLGRLRSDYDAFLVKCSRAISDNRKRQRFLFNNYSLILTIIGDATGKLADEQRAYFEDLRQRSSDRG